MNETANMSELVRGMCTPNDLRVPGHCKVVLDATNALAWSGHLAHAQGIQESLTQLLRPGSACPNGPARPTRSPYQDFAKARRG